MQLNISCIGSSIDKGENQQFHKEKDEQLFFFYLL